MSNNELVLLRRIEELEKLIQRQPEVGGVWQDWTPTPIGLTGASITSSIGKLMKIGNTAFVFYRIDILSWTGYSGKISISAPFTAAERSMGQSNYYRTGSSSQQGAGSLTIYATTNVFQYVDTTGGDLVNWESSARVILQGSIFYEIA